MPGLWKVLFFIAICMIAGLLLLAVNARRIGRKRVRPVESCALDPDRCRHLAQQLSACVQLETVTGAEGTVWAAARAWLKKTYPLVHKRLTWETVAVHTLLYHWKAPVPEEGNPLLLCAHMDVAPAAGDWTHAPFSGIVEDGFVWGRGAVDGKGPLVCLLDTLERLLAEGFEPQRDVYVALTHDAGVWGEEGAEQTARYFARRNLRFDMILDQGDCLHREFFSLRRPVACVGVAGKGFSTWRMSVQGLGGQASTPPAYTAAGRLAEATVRLESYPCAPVMTPILKQTLTALAPYLSFHWRMEIANLWLFRRRILKRLSKKHQTNAWVRSVMAVTGVRAGDGQGILPVNAQAQLQVSLLPGESDHQVQSYLRGLFVGLDIDIVPLMRMESTAEADRKHPSFSQLTEAIGAVFGEVPVVPVISPYPSDAHHYAVLSGQIFRFTPFVLSETLADSAGGVDERLPVEALARAAVFYERLIRTWARKAEADIPVDDETV